MISISTQTLEGFTQFWREYIEVLGELAEQAGKQTLWNVLRTDLLMMVILAADKRFPLTDKQEKP
jgi:hypothetical protein